MCAGGEEDTYEPHLADCCGQSDEEAMNAKVIAFAALFGVALLLIAVFVVLFLVVSM